MSERMNMQQFIAESPLNWPVNKYPAFIQVDGEFIPVPNRYFTTRVDDNGGGALKYTPFEAVAEGYTVIQNQDGFQCLTDLVDSGELIVDSALELSGGKTIAISARLPEHVEIAGQDVATHLIFGTNHARGGSAVIFSHNRQLSCANELAALKIAKQYKYTIRHSRNAFIRLEDARQGLRLSFQHTQEMKKLGESLASEKIDNAFYNKFLRSLVELDKIDPAKKERAYRRAQGQRYAIHNIMRDADYLDDYRFTKWGLYQAVTDYESNVRQHRGDPNRYRMKLASGQAPLTNRALELLTA
jgi:phage/plasmid-like protein (TIGR03299 family)